MKVITPVSSVAIISLLIIVLGNYFLQKTSVNNKIAEYSECQLLSNHCKIKMGNHSVSIMVDGDLKPLKAFSIQLNDADELLTKAEVYLNMKDMDMGLNKFIFKPAGNKTWFATVLIPVCTTGIRDWRFEFHLSGKKINTNTVFDVKI